MTNATTPNPFAPPRAHVEDPYGTAPAELVIASRGARFLAFLVDLSPMLVIGVIGGIMAAVMLPGMLTGHFDPQTSGLASLGIFVVVIGALALAWTIWNIVLLYKYGQTVGKKVLGIRVVRMDGSRVSFARFFFLRGLAIGIIGAVVGGIGGAMHFKFAGNIVTLVDYLMIFGVARRCLHDFIADTQVATAASSPNATLEGASGR
jgi:uncharacterized RDD family membrane protein YckC